MITWVLKGDINMCKFRYSEARGSGNYCEFYKNPKAYTENLNIESYFINGNIEDERNINYNKELYFKEIYNIFIEKINEIHKYLDNNNINIENWNLDLILKTGTQIYEDIQDKYIKENCLENINLNDDIFKNFLDKVKLNFEEIDEDSEEDIEKYSQYYDFLNDMFISIQEVLEDETSKLTNIADIENIQQRMKVTFNYENYNHYSYGNIDDKYNEVYLKVV